MTQDVAKFFGLELSEAKRFNKFLKKHGLQDVKEYRFNYEKSENRIFNDGEILNFWNTNPKINRVSVSIYNIKPGDTLEGIASEMKIPVNDLKQANGLKSDKIRDDDFLLLPLPFPGDKLDGKTTYSADNEASVNSYKIIPDK